MPTRAFMLHSQNANFSGSKTDFSGLFSRCHVTIGKTLHLERLRPPTQGCRISGEETKGVEVLKDEASDRINAFPKTTPGKERKWGSSRCSMQLWKLSFLFCFLMCSTRNTGEEERGRKKSWWRKIAAKPVAGKKKETSNLFFEEQRLFHCCCNEKEETTKTEKSHLFFTVTFLLALGRVQCTKQFMRLFRNPRTD